MTKDDLFCSITSYIMHKSDEYILMGDAALYYFYYIGEESPYKIDFISTAGNTPEIIQSYLDEHTDIKGHINVIGQMVVIKLYTEGDISLLIYVYQTMTTFEQLTVKHVNDVKILDINEILFYKCVNVYKTQNAKDFYEMLLIINTRRNQISTQTLANISVMLSTMPQIAFAEMIMNLSNYEDLEELIATMQKVLLIKILKGNDM